MVHRSSNRREQLNAFEFDAEWLAVEQVDLLGQIEAQLRLVRQTMRQIEKLRGVKHRVGPELSNGERGAALKILTRELGTLTKHLSTQGTTCREMLDTVERMQRRLDELVRSATKRHLKSERRDDSEPEPGIDA